MKKKLKYLGFIILIAIIGYNLKEQYFIKKGHNERMERFENSENMTLYFKDGSSMIIDKGFVATIADFSNKYGGNNYQSDTMGEVISYNGQLLILGLERHEQKSWIGLKEYSYHICIYKYLKQADSSTRSQWCRTLDGYYYSFK